MNIQIIRDLAEIADDENLMEKLSKYLKKLVAQKKDSAAMTQEEFSQVFSHSAIKRAKLTGLRRNARLIEENLDHE